MLIYPITRQTHRDQHDILRVSKIDIYTYTRSLGALRAPTSSLGPSGLFDFVLYALRALRPCDPKSNAHAHMCVFALDGVKNITNERADGQGVSRSRVGYNDDEYGSW